MIKNFYKSSTSILGLFIGLDQAVKSPRHDSITVKATYRFIDSLLEKLPK